MKSIGLNTETVGVSKLKSGSMAKRKFHILTDSGSDLPQEYFAEHGVECVKLGFIMDGVEYLGENGQEIDLQAFYGRLRAGAKPTTYQITPEVAQARMRRVLEKGLDILVIAFSSGLSGTADSFFVAQKALSKEYPERKIFVVDSLCASLGQGLLVNYVVEKADEGATIEETYEYAENLKLSINHQFTVNDLFHLKRGGRVSSATAIVGTMLNVKPMLHVSDEGKLTTTGKVMGRQKSLRKLVQNMQESADLGESDPIYISHADCIEDARFVQGLLQKSYPQNPIFISYIGPVIGSHAGGGTVALFFKSRKR